MDKETVMHMATIMAQGIRGEVREQMTESPAWAYTLMQGGAWALAVLYAEYTGDGIDPMDLIQCLSLETDMGSNERRTLVEELFNGQ